MAPSPPQEANPDITTAVVEVDVDNAPPSWDQGLQHDDEVDYESKCLEWAPCYVVNFKTESCTKKVLSSPDEARQELKADAETASRRLIVLHGLPIEYIRVFIDELDLDEGLVGATARRRKYQHAKGKNSATTLTSFEYPELVQSVASRPAVVEVVGRVRDVGCVTDILDDPLKVVISDDDEAIFCRTTLWEGKKGTVLFLDHSFWHDPLSFVEKGRRDEVKSLERRLWDCIDTQGSSICLSETIEAVAFEHWVELFESLQPEMRITDEEFTALFWQTQRGLERNVDMSQRCNSETNHVLQNWPSLLERSERYRRLALDMRLFETREQIPQTADFARIPVDSQEPSHSNENQRSLDRVTYLGGILLPISIVSGILSMGDTFGPGEDMFYVFWAIAVPLTVLTLLVIYADSIRREVVWVESSVQESYGRSDSDSLGEHRRPKNKVKEAHPISMPSLEQGVPYSYTEPVPISSAPQLEADVQSVSSEPVRMLQSKFGRGKKPGTWKRQELGWVGAWKCILQVSEVKKMQSLPSRGRRSSEEEV